MKSKHLVSAVVCAFVLVFVTQTFAQEFRQWTPLDGVPVRKGDYPVFNSLNQAIAFNDNGEACFIWSQNGLDNCNLFLQKINSAGQPLWGEDGIELNYEGRQLQENQAVLDAGGGNWWIIFSSITDDYGKNIRLQKVNSHGTELLEVGGVELFGNNDYCYDIQLFPTRENGLYVIAYDMTRAIVRKVNANGQLEWNGEARYLYQYEDVQYNLREVTGITDDNDAIILTWRLREAYSPYIQRIHTTRLDSAGTLTWGESPTDFLTLYEDAIPAVSVKSCSDGNGGAYIVWNSSAADTLAMQHVNQDGDFTWEGGISIGSFSFDYTSLFQLVPGSDGDAYLAATANSQNYYETDIIAQRFKDDDGDLILYLGPDGNEEEGLLIGTAASEQLPSLNLQAIPGPDGGMIISWTAGDLGIMALHTEYVLDLGFNRWGNVSENVLISDENAIISDYTLASTTDGENITYAMLDTTTRTPVLRWQTVNSTNGNPFLEEGGEQVMAWVDSYVGNISVTEATNENDVYFSWLDYEYRNTPCSQAISLDTGERLWDVVGNNLIPGYPNDSLFVDTLSSRINSAGELISVWSDSRSPSTQHVMVQKTSPAGEMLFADTGAVVCEPGLLHYDISPMFSLDSEDRINVAFERFYMGHRWVRLQQLTSDGEPAWTGGRVNGIDALSDPFRPIHLLSSFTQSYDLLTVIGRRVEDDGSNSILAATYSGTGDLLWSSVLVEQSPNLIPATVEIRMIDDVLLVVWQDYLDEDLYSLRAQAVQDDGELLWPDSLNGIELVDHSAIAFDIEPAQDESSFFWLVWQNSDNDLNPAAIFSQRFDWDGTPLLDFENGVIAVNEASFRHRHELVAGPYNDLWVVWTEHYYINRYEDEAELRYAHIDESGVLVDDAYDRDNGLLLTEVSACISELHAVPDGAGGILVAWVDDRADYSRDYDFSDFRDLYTQHIVDGYVGVKEISDNTLPHEFKLHPVYPNPFNPVVHVQVDIPETRHVKVAVYDVLGREVATVTNRTLVQGSHSFTWNGHGFASGIYFVRMEAGAFSTVQKATLLK